MTLIMEGFERFPEGVVPTASLSSRQYDVLDAQVYSGGLESSVTNEMFGFAVSISGDGDTVAVGASNYRIGTLAAGVVYIFKRNGNSYSLQARLDAEPSTGHQRFGDAVSLSADGNTLIASAPIRTENFGSMGVAYVFVRSGGTWTQQAKLIASDAAASENFGRSVSLSSDGSIAIVGKPYDGENGSNSGSAYVFVRSGDTWTQQAKLTANDAAASDVFGYSASLSSDGAVALIGAYFKATNGAAYVFTRSGDTWTQQAKLTASDGASSDQFGRSVSLSPDGSTAVIGAYGDDDHGSNSGSAYVFVRSGDTWAQQAKLTADDAAATDSFGYSTSISSNGSRVVVGAYVKAEAAGVNVGAAYVFSRSGNTWSQQAKLSASDASSPGYFGWEVAIPHDGSRVVVGSPYKAVGATATVGSTYVYTDTGSGWSEEILNPRAAVANPVGGVLTVSQSHRNLRGFGLNYARTTTNANAHMAAARFKLPLNAWTKRIVGFALRLNTVGSVTPIAGFASDASPAIGVIAPASISVQTTAPYLRLNTTPFTQPVTLGDWFYVELLVDRTALTVTAYLNGTEVGSAAITSGQADSMGRFAFEIPASAANQNFDVDDFYFMDDVDETQPIVPIGMCKVDLMPVDTVVSAAWTPQPSGTTTPEALAVPLDPDTYVESASDGAADVLGHGFIDGGPEATDDVLRVQAVSVVTLSEDAPQVTTGLTVGETTKTVTSSGAPDETVVLRATADVTMKASALADVQSGYAVGSDW